MTATQQFLDSPQTIVWFSRGVTSAVAARIASMERPCRIVYCDLSSSEHPDGARFQSEVAAWIDRPIETIASKKYRTPDEVFEREQYMAGPYGARCTTELKKLPRLAFARPDDTNIFGFSADEPARIAKFEKNNPDLRLDWVLQRHGITKAACFDILYSVGIRPPSMYALGFANNNCIACVKARSIIYWLRTRRHFPEVFARRAAQSRALGVRLIQFKDSLCFLDEIESLSPDALEPEESVSCGPECGDSQPSATN